VASDEGLKAEFRGSEKEGTKKLVLDRGLVSRAKKENTKKTHTGTPNRKKKKTKKKNKGKKKERITTPPKNTTKPKPTPQQKPQKPNPLPPKTLPAPPPQPPPTPHPTKSHSTRVIKNNDCFCCQGSVTTWEFSFGRGFKEQILGRRLVVCEGIWIRHHKLLNASCKEPGQMQTPLSFFKRF